VQVELLTIHWYPGKHKQEVDETGETPLLLSTLLHAFVQVPLVSEVYTVIV